MENEFLSLGQIDSLLGSVRLLRHRLQILFLADGGLRVSEMLNLKWENLDFRTRTVVVATLKKKDKGVKRSIPMSNRLYDCLADYIEEIGGRGNGYIFSKDGGSSPISRQAVNKMLKQLEGMNPEVEDVHPHKLRHSFATNLRAAGAELEDIRDALGHSRLETSLIYAHQDQDKLRSLINRHHEVKPSFFSRIKAMLFPGKKAAKVSVLEYDGNYTVGRVNEVKRIENAIERNINVVISGPVGIGKSHLLNAIKFKRTVLEIDDLKDFRKSLLNILLFLFDGDKEAAAKMLFSKNERDDLHKTINRDSLNSLCDLLMQITVPKEYVLRISDIDTITPSVVRAVERLKNHFVIITTVREIKMNTFFIYDFERIALEPLPRVEGLRLFHKLCSQMQFESMEHARNKVWDIAQGNPKMIVELCTRLSKEDFLDTDVVSEICDNYIGRETREFDMSIILFILLGGVMALRYIGNESNDPDLRMIGGLMVIVMLFARSFFKISKRTGL